MSHASTINAEQVLHQEAVQLDQIASRLERSIEQFEAYMQSRTATSHEESVSDANDGLLARAELNQTTQLARDLREERRMLIHAWEQLEREQRSQLEFEQRIAKGGKTPPVDGPEGGLNGAPPLASSVSSSLSMSRPVPRVSTLPVAPNPEQINERSKTESAAKRMQFRQLQREIDRHRS